MYSAETVHVRTLCICTILCQMRERFAFVSPEHMYTVVQKIP